MFLLLVIIDKANSCRGFQVPGTPAYALCEIVNQVMGSRLFVHSATGLTAVDWPSLVHAGVMSDWRVETSLTASRTSQRMRLAVSMGDKSLHINCLVSYVYRSLRKRRLHVDD